MEKQTVLKPDEEEGEFYIGQNVFARLENSQMVRLRKKYGPTVYIDTGSVDILYHTIRAKTRSRYRVSVRDSHWEIIGDTRETVIREWLKNQHLNSLNQAMLVHNCTLNEILVHPI